MIAWKLLWENPICHPAVMIRRDVLQQSGINYDRQCVVEDYDLWTRLLFHTQFGHIPRVLIQYRQSAAGMTGTRDLRQVEATSRIQQRTLSTLLGRSLDARVGYSTALLSQQTAARPAAEQILDARSLVLVGREVYAAFVERFAVTNADAAHIRADLARRFLDWGFVLSGLPSRSHDATGGLMRAALTLDPRAFVSRRAARNLFTGFLGKRRVTERSDTKARLVAESGADPSMGEQD